MPHVALLEWETRGPANCMPLMGLQLSRGAGSEALLRSLADGHKLELLELQGGVEIRANSWVGQLAIDDLSISISPKITGLPLLTLLRYAYSLRNLRTFAEAGYTAASMSFADLIVAQLAEEVSELLARGLHRDYKRSAGRLTLPRGRIDFTRRSNPDTWASCTLPCTFFDRSDAVFINRIILGGLELAWRIASDRLLRITVASLAQILASMMSAERLTRSSLAIARRALDRRTGAYAAALTLIQLLHDGCGFDLGAPDDSVRLPGFLFDMNAFFQDLIWRFLTDEADGFRVEPQHRIRGMFVSDPDHPLKRAPPVLKPDFAVFTGDKVAELLDAKYRDLWLRRLPPEMLYQLAMYALSNPAVTRATILYPTLAPEAVDQVLRIQEPIHGNARGSVVLRPVNLFYLAQLTGDLAGKAARKERRDYARFLAFGPAWNLRTRTNRVTIADALSGLK